MKKSGTTAGEKPAGLWLLGRHVLARTWERWAPGLTQAPAHWPIFTKMMFRLCLGPSTLPCRVGNHPVIGVEEAGVGSRTVQWGWGWRQVSSLLWGPQVRDVGRGGVGLSEILLRLSQPPLMKNLCSLMIALSSWNFSVLNSYSIIWMFLLRRYNVNLNLGGKHWPLMTVWLLV